MASKFSVLHSLPKFLSADSLEQCLSILPGNFDLMKLRGIFQVVFEIRAGILSLPVLRCTRSSLHLSKPSSDLKLTDGVQLLLDILLDVFVPKSQ